MKRGFTLIETVISIGLAAMLLLVVLDVNMMSLNMSYKARQRDMSFNIARGICEVFKSEGEMDYEYDIRIYKYIDDIGEIESIKQLFDTKDGNVSDDSLAINGCYKRFTVIAEINKSYLNGGNLSLLPRFKILKLVVIEKGRENSPIKLVYAR